MSCLHAIVSQRPPFRLLSSSIFGQASSSCVSSSWTYCCEAAEKGERREGGGVSPHSWSSHSILSTVHQLTSRLPFPHCVSAVEQGHHRAGVSVVPSVPLPWDIVRWSGVVEGGHSPGGEEGRCKACWRHEGRVPEDRLGRGVFPREQK